MDKKQVLLGMNGLLFGILDIYQKNGGVNMGCTGKKLKVVQYGCGKMAAYTMRYVYEKGGEIVGAIDVDDNIVGLDIGEIMGCGKKGVKVINAIHANDVLMEKKPDCCIITTMSFMKDVRDAFLICAMNGINAISTCEEAFYPWNSSYNITKLIDDKAQETGCTVCGSGYQDFAWGYLIDQMAGSSQKIDSIRGSSSYNVEDYGIALARAHGAVLTIDEFNRTIASVDNVSDEQRREMINRGEFVPSYMWSVNGWLCRKLNLRPVSQTQRCVPMTYDKPLKSETLGITIPAGNATGMSAIVTTETEEGIKIISECIGKVYAPGEFDKNVWSVNGEPNTTVVIERPSTVEMTCASVVNRIPDVINARPGFLTTAEIGPLKYRTLPLGEYVSR